eukprot:jgi/Mesvir1/5187/Mv15320-RA.1
MLLSLFPADCDACRNCVTPSTNLRPVNSALPNVSGLRARLSYGRLAGSAKPCEGFVPVPRTKSASQVSRTVTASAAPSTDKKSQAVTVEAALTSSSGELIHLYRRPFLGANATATLLHQAQSRVSKDITGIDTEQCYNVDVSRPLNKEQAAKVAWLLRETFEPELLTPATSFAKPGGNEVIIEVGPRMAFTTAWSTNAVSICKSCGVDPVTRIERSRRFRLTSRRPLAQDEITAFAALVHDRMTECLYPKPLPAFTVDATPAPVELVPVMAQGIDALRAINDKMGLAFDEWDLQYYTRLFRDDIKRDPTTVELFDMAQSNSEHSRHWFFKGGMVIDGDKKSETLMDIVRDTLDASPHNSVIGFKDNSSAIRGGPISVLVPSEPGKPCALKAAPKDYDLLLTAETHNFPCAVAPYPGAETGAGGRIRDTHATGRGSMVIAATAGYCVGNLQIPQYPQPWEHPEWVYPPNLASPLQILIDASNGASDYGNKFGEPLIQGYTRTFGMRLLNGERREWLKPIMFSAGVGQIDHTHLEKAEPEIGMLIVKIGGPAYRIGMGGGAASSMVSGTRDADLDFNAVQRGDAEMAQKLWRAVRACVELGDANPIVSIHDQGAGGNCNVVKEIIYPQGAEIDIRKVPVGDTTMSVLEIWGAEYQEQDALLIKPESEALMRAICERERVTMAVIGTISGSGKVVLRDSIEEERAAAEKRKPLVAVDLELEKVLGSMPQKTYTFTHRPVESAPIALPQGTSPADALARVLRLPGVGSKRFLTNKVDRSVTGLVARQQCVGPLQLPLSDVAVIAQSHMSTTGIAFAIGEAPIKGLLDSKAMARVALGEALTNLVWARVSGLRDIKSSGNWMYAAKMEYEGAVMFDAAVALREAMITLGVAIDGGKDSLSMAAKAGGEVVKCPGNMVISAYVGCPDITATVTPDLKLGDDGRLLLVDIAQGRRRLGGSALGQAYSQLGDTVPDMDDLAVMRSAFETTQGLIAAKKISAGHDVSDGGVVTSLLEMAFAGDCGIDVDLPVTGSSADGKESQVFRTLFAEELGLVIEVSSANVKEVMAAYASKGVPCLSIGRVRKAKGPGSVKVAVGGSAAIQDDVVALRDVWEEASFVLETFQANEATVKEEREGLKKRHAPKLVLPYTPVATPPELMAAAKKHRVAVIREEGCNGDREMAAALHAAGLEPWDVTMSDLLAGKVSLDSFKGLIFAGGFSYADVLDSAKGWAGSIRFNAALWEQFQKFYKRPDTFSLGICNGCQLMALLGWVPGQEVLPPATAAESPMAREAHQPRFVHNSSGRFESRFVNVQIQQSPSVLLKGMEGATIGVWVAHGEGMALFPDTSTLNKVKELNLAPVRYCNDDNQVTEVYPFNPNGSPMGIASLCSPDGRHLAMMPHPERCFMMWQLPYVPPEWNYDLKGPGPWLKMFQNARIWCDSHV